VISTRCSSGTSSAAASTARAATTRGARSTLEWSIPSPPPEYNFAQIPEVTSRYPLWDLKAPEKTAGIDHSHADAMTITDAHAVPVHEETERRTAKELGIPMPFPTVKPLVVALGMVIMFSGLLFLRFDMFAIAMAVTIGGAASWWAASTAGSPPRSSNRRHYDSVRTRRSRARRSRRRARHTTTPPPGSTTARSPSGRSSGPSACCSRRSSRRT
jgi:hypothetical protein